MGAAGVGEKTGCDGAWSRLRLVSQPPPLRAGRGEGVGLTLLKPPQGDEHPDKSTLTSCHIQSLGLGVLTLPGPVAPHPARSQVSFQIQRSLTHCSQGFQPAIVSGGGWSCKRGASYRDLCSPSTQELVPGRGPPLCPTLPAGPPQAALLL